MPRNARKLSPNNIYHIVVKGANRQLMFECKSDYEKYLDYLSYYKEELDFDIYAYCLMSNHIHLLIDTKNCSLESIFRHLNTSYSNWFNLKYQRTGYLQEGRFFSEPVDNVRYLLTAIRYIHQNPFHAGLEKNIGDSYPWSSIHSYKKQKSDLVNVKKIMELYSGIDEFLLFQSLVSKERLFDIDKTRHRIPDDVAKEIIFRECKCLTTTDFQKLTIKGRDIAIKKLLENGLSIRQINRLTGISKGVIERLSLS